MVLPDDDGSRRSRRLVAKWWYRVNLRGRVAMAW